MTEYLVALLGGVAFGFALQKAGLTYYRNIVNVFRFTDLTVIKFMMTAIAVSMVGVFALNSLGITPLPAVPATYLVGNLVGGLIFGVGMAGAGF
ncbi:MAG: YeeE/YedE thiosulfate transporter family protein [Chloroflexota bacterium]